MHPQHKPPLTAVAVYDLSGKYTRFDGIVARPDGTMRGNQTFVHLLGDGQLLWKSPTIYQPSPQASFDIDVTGVQELTLKVEALNDSNEAHILWVDPRLSLAVAPKSLTGTPSLSHRLTSPDFEWTKPENLGPDVNGTFFDEHPELTPDGLKLWFSGGGDLWISSRNSLDAPFGKRINAGTQINDGASWDSEPTLSADRLTLVFYSDRGPNKKDQNLWMSVRSQANGVFDNPVKLGDEINTPAWETCPALSADGLTLIFSSTRPGSLGDIDLWQATRTNTSAELGNVTNLGPTINSPSRDSGAHISSDGLVLFFESDRAGGAGKNDLYLSTRPTKDAPFGKPVSFDATINTPDAEQGPCLSSDGQTLMFYSDRPGGQGEADIWMSRRVPVSK